MHEGLLDGDGSGPLRGDNDDEAFMQRTQPYTEFGFGVARQHAVRHVDEPRAIHLDHAPAHPGEAGIETEDADGRHGEAL